MKPFVAIDGVLDYLFAKYFGSVSVEKCAQTENLHRLARWRFFVLCFARDVGDNPSGVGM